MEVVMVAERQNQVGLGKIRIAVPAHVRVPAKVCDLHEGKG
jgi:hypothetical protein